MHGDKGAEQLLDASVLDVEHTCRLCSLQVSMQWTAQDVEEAETLDMAQHCPGITRTRVLLVHGDKDTMLPVDASRSYEKVIPGATVRVIAGGDHNFDAQAPAKEMVGVVVDFFAGAPDS